MWAGLSYHILSATGGAGDSFIQIARTLPVAESYVQMAVSDGSPGILGLLTCGGPRGTWDERPTMAKPEP